MNLNSSTPLPLFDGKTYNERLDGDRLTGQAGRVWRVMEDGRWRTLAEIQIETAVLWDAWDSQAGISARLRDFRKEPFGRSILPSALVPGAIGRWTHSIGSPSAARATSIATR